MDKEKNIDTKKDDSMENCIHLCLKEDVTEGGNTSIEENSGVMDKLTSIFDDPECAYSLIDVMEELEEIGYENPGGIITLALQDNVLYVDSIDKDGTVYLALRSEQDGED